MIDDCVARPATWQMNASTIIMPCNYTGYQDPSTTAGWGVVDFDWSNNLAGWSASILGYATMFSAKQRVIFFV